MFRTLERHAVSILYSLGALALALIALFWLLNLAANRTPSPIAGIASTVAQRASGQAYGY